MKSAQMDQEKNSIVQKIVEYKSSWITRWGVLILVTFSALIISIVSTKTHIVTLDITGRYFKTGDYGLCFVPDNETAFESVVRKTNFKDATLLLDGQTDKIVSFDDKSHCAQATGFKIIDSFPQSEGNCKLRLSFSLFNLLNLLVLKDE